VSRGIICDKVLKSRFLVLGVTYRKFLCSCVRLMSLITAWAFSVCMRVCLRVRVREFLLS
jgi:hypothetical protein